MPEYDPFAPEVMANPLPFYRELRDRGAAHPLPQYDAWALPRFEDVWQVLADRERFSIVEGPIFPRDRLAAPNHGAPATTTPRPLPSFSMIDPPVHTRVRRAMLPPFLPNTVATMEADVRAHTRALLDDLAARDAFDAVTDLGSPVAAIATCRLLGLPASDHDTIVRQVNVFTRRTPGESGVSPEGRATQATLHAYMSGFARESRGRGGLVDLLAAYDTGDGEPLSDAEIAVQLTTLLVGGVETLPKIVAGGLLRLWQHPEQRAALVADPPLVGNGFEEIMRLEAVLQWVGRTLLVDTELGGQPVRAGQRVFLLLVSANHDEREFADPDTLDVRRPFPRTLVFGHGVHYCIGVHTARLEGRVILEEVLERLPDYTIDEQGIERPPSEFQIGYTAMPVQC